MVKSNVAPLGGCLGSLKSCCGLIWCEALSDGMDLGVLAALTDVGTLTV